MTDPLRLLLVEDDDIDAEGVERALRRAQISNPIERAIGGIEALARLRGTDGRPPLQRPYLILLDLNMPRMGGLTFLEELRADPVLSDSIVFVLTTSDADRDKAAAYSSHVAGYMLKSRVGRYFSNLLQWLDPYWTNIEFPSGSSLPGGQEPLAKPIRLLVVDDDELDVELVRRAAPKHFEIAEARTAAECKAILAKVQPDCILLDYRLPDEDGLSLLPHLRQTGTPVVIMTGVRDERVRASARELGASNCVIKDSLSRDALPAIVAGAIADAGR